MPGRLAVAVAVGLLTLTVSAVAAARFFPGEQVTVSPASEASFELKCQPGQRIARGLGFHGYVSPTGDIAVLPLEVSRPSQRRISFRVANRGSTVGLFSASTFCDRKAPRAREITASKALKPGASGSATARCPEGTRILNGGFRASGDALGSALIRSAHKRGDRAWTVAGVNADDASQSITALAYCGKGGRELTRSASTEIAGTGSSKDVRSQCPHGREAVMGGFDAELAASPSISGLLVYNSQQINRRTWSTRATYVGSGGPRTLTAFAYCR
jgi:hypothetical protein